MTKTTQATCQVCGKPLSNPDSVAMGIGPICQHSNPELVAARKEELTRDEVPTHYIKFTEAMKICKVNEIPVSRLMKAMGGDRAMSEPLDSVFEPIYVGRTRYVHKSAVNKSNLAKLTKMQRDNVAEAKPKATKKAAKPKAKAKAKAKAKPTAKQKVAPVSGSQVAARRRRQATKQGETSFADLPAVE